MLSYDALVVFLALLLVGLVAIGIAAVLTVLCGTGGRIKATVTSMSQV
jgi:hypothetical protein